MGTLLFTAQASRLPETHAPRDGLHHAEGRVSPAALPIHPSTSLAPLPANRGASEKPDKWDGSMGQIKRIGLAGRQPASDHLDPKSFSISSGGASEFL